MMKKFKPLTVKSIPVDDVDHPESPHIALPKHEFTWGFIAPPGSGKTTLMINLLDMYRGYFHRIKVFSPTVLSDDKWDWLKEQKLLAENTPLKDWIKKKLEEERKEQIASDHPLSQEVLELDDEEFSPFLSEEDFYDDYDDDSFRKLMESQKAIITLLKKLGQPKYLADRCLIIFDDLVGSPLFKGQKGSYFTGVVTRHRHYGTSMFVVTQGYKEIPKTIRTALKCLSIFEIGNEQELRVIYEEFGMGLSFSDWMEVYEHAVKDHDFGFLFLDYKKPRLQRMMRNFEEIIFHQDK